MAAIGAHHVAPVCLNYLRPAWLSAGTLAMVRALAKSLDLLVSFVIGFASDQTRTPFGRRLPYIAVGSVFAPLAMWFLAAPPAAWNLNSVDEGRRLGEAASAAGAALGLASSSSRGHLRFDEVCVEEAAAAAFNHSNCLTLQRCVEAAVDAAQLPGWQERPHYQVNGSHPADAAASAGFHLAVWFLVFFVVRHSIGHTLVMIPYDALGQELTSNSAARQVCSAFERTPRFCAIHSQSTRHACDRDRSNSLRGSRCSTSSGSSPPT